MLSWICNTVCGIIISVARYYINEIVKPIVIDYGTKTLYACLGVGF